MLLRLLHACLLLFALLLFSLFGDHSGSKYCCFSLKSSSYEDWGVDELIVEDSWKRQVGGD